MKPNQRWIANHEEKLPASSKTLNNVASFVANGENNITCPATRATAHCHSVDKQTFVNNEPFYKIKRFDPYVIRTRNLLIWSQTRYRCAKESVSSGRHSYNIDQYCMCDIQDQ